MRHTCTVKPHNSQYKKAPYELLVRKAQIRSQSEHLDVQRTYSRTKQQKGRNTTFTHTWKYAQVL